MRKSIECMWHRRNRVAYLHFLKDISQREIAKIIGCCEKTVWNDVQALRDNLKRKWAYKAKIEAAELKRFESQHEKAFEIEQMLEKERIDNEIGNMLSEWF